MKSQDHKNIICQIMVKNLAEFFVAYPEQARAIIEHDFGTTWRQTVKPSNWKRESKSSDKHSDPSTGRTWTSVERTFVNSVTGNRMTIREELEDGRERILITMQTETYVPEVRRLLDWQNGSTGEMRKTPDGKTDLRMGRPGEQDITPPARESILDTPKPEGFGAFA